MDKINKALRIIFIISATIFLLFLTGLPKTDCQACSLDYEGEKIDGYEAWEIFEEACITYYKPWDVENVYIDLENISWNKTEDGIINITINEDILK